MCIRDSKRTATPHSQGMIEVDPQGRVLQFVEKPAGWQGGDTANAGVYVCQPELVDSIPPGFSDFGHDIIPALLRNKQAVYGVALRGYLDVYKRQALLCARTGCAHLFVADWR